MSEPFQSVLLAIVGEDDPFTPGLVGDVQLTGPILSAQALRAFGRTILLAARDLETRAEETAEALRERYPGLEVAVVPLGLAMEAPPEQLCERVALVAGASTTDGDRVTYLAGAVPVEALTAVAGANEILDPQVPLYAGDTAKAMPNRVERRDAGIAREPRVRYGSSRSPVAYAEHDGVTAADRLDVVARRMGIRGEHPALRAALETVAALAEHPVPVLIDGETGTGKSLIARLIHELSGRVGGPLVQVNCGALPEKLVESTLFGHRKGAFTGATEDHAGKFQAANGGTLFLDEVGELPIELQPKLLKVLEDGVVEPVGATRGTAVNVRIIAATNRDLKAMVAARTFREDLYYRLSFGLVRLPPLRERRSDIQHLALHALARINASLRTPKRLTPEAIARLEKQEWRGNVRDLENVIGRSVLLSRGDVLDADDLLIDEPVRADDPLAQLPTPNEAFSLETFLASARKQLILRALEISCGSQSGAARLLGLSPQAVHKFLNPR